MPSGRCDALSELPSRPRAIFEEARRGVLSTIDTDGTPHSVPVVFVRVDGNIVSPIDDKPKSGPELARVKNLALRPQATLLVDHWDEDWVQLGWVMVRGEARVVQQAIASEQLRARYPQYAGSVGEGQRSIVLEPHRISWWTWEE